MTLGKHGPSFFSAIGALFVHLVFFFLAGYIIQNRLRTPQKPSYNLKMLNKKLSLPAKKQPIRESEPMIKPEIAPSIKPQAVQALSSRQKIKQAVSTAAVT